MDLHEFEEYLILKGHRPYTIECHLRRMRQLLNACSPFEQKTVRSFLITKRKAGIKATSLNRLIITLRHFSVCHKLNWGTKYPLFTKLEEPQKEIFSDEQIEAVINLPCQPRFRKLTWARWTMWLKVLSFSGMRASEVSTLTVDQIDWATNNFVLPKTKTKPRRVPIAMNIKNELLEYVKGKDKYLFPVSSKRGYVWRQGWQKHIDLRLKVLGIKRDGLTTHSFRHSFITNLWEENVPAPDIMNIVGHSDITTTLKYSHLGNKSAQKSINRHSIIQKQAPTNEMLEAFIEEGKRRGIFNTSKFEYEVTGESLYIRCKS